MYIMISFFALIAGFGLMIIGVLEMAFHHFKIGYFTIKNNPGFIWIVFGLCSIIVSFIIPLISVRT